MGVAGCSAATLIGTSSTIFLLIGIATIAGFIAALVTFVSTLVPNYIAYSGIGAGVTISSIAVMGFVSVCSKKKPKCWLSIFMFFDFIVFLSMAVIAFYMLRSSDALKVLNQSGFTNVTSDLDKSVSSLVMNGVHSTFDACQANVSLASTAASGDKLFDMSCYKTEWNTVSPARHRRACHARVRQSETPATLTTAAHPLRPSPEQLADIVNGNCMGADHYVLEFNATNPTTFEACFADQSFWTAEQNGYLGPVAWAYINLMVDTPKGVFCQCYGPCWPQMNGIIPPL
eukprot:340599-Prymnesium_polylepis.3